MNSAEHYHRAEQLLELALITRQGNSAEVVAEAQVHATLALTHIIATQVALATAPAGDDL